MQGTVLFRCRRAWTSGAGPQHPGFRRNQDRVSGRGPHRHCYHPDSYMFSVRRLVQVTRTYVHCLLPSAKEMRLLPHTFI